MARKKKQIQGYCFIHCFVYPVNCNPTACADVTRGHTAEIPGVADDMMELMLIWVKHLVL